MAKSDKERKAAERARRRAAGYRPFEVWVHLDDWPKVKRFIERLTRRRSKS